VAHTGGSLRIVAADIGVSGLLRRLGVAKFAHELVDRVPRRMITWDSVAPIADTHPFSIRLSISENRLGRFHPSELADIISELSANDAARVVGSLDDETTADALEHLDHDKQKTLVEDLGTGRAANIIEEMDSDDAADLLGELPAEQQAELLAEMAPQTAGELRDLVKYDPDTAGCLMTTDYVWIYPALAGKYASLLFAIGLLNAAIFTAAILPLSTAYYVCEAFGFESGVEQRFSDAKIFYAIYAGMIVLGAGFVLLPGAPLLATIFYSQVLNGVLLPVVLVLMLILINNPRIMGTYVNGVSFNIIAWATVIIMGSLTIASTIALFLGAGTAAG
jgi:hypothetical protein